MSISALIATAILLLANAFFVAVEFANVASRRPKLEAAAEEGDRRSVAALNAVRNISFQLAGAQLGITVASLLLGFVAEPALAHAIQPLIEGLGAGKHSAHVVALLIGLFIVVFLHMVFGEMVPKNIALTFPEGTARQLALPMALFTFIFRPIVWGLNTLANGLTRMVGVTPRNEVMGAQESADITRMVGTSRQEGLIDESEHRLLSGMLNLPSLTVESAMTPRSQIVALPRVSSVSQVQEVIGNTHYSRILIYGASLEQVSGFVHAKDLLNAQDNSNLRPIPRRYLRPVLSLYSKSPVNEALQQMLDAQIQFGVVQDASHSVVGVVTLEDLLEMVVGEILDEHGH